MLSILDSSGNTVVAYAHDAWGNIVSITGSLSGTLGFYNPLRYRGYVHDHEYALYYLQSRYYEPFLGRFQTPDAFASTGQGLLGNNMYAYCLNNPVSYADSTGNAAMICFGNDVNDLSVTWKAHGGGTTNYNGGMSSLSAATGPLKRKLTFGEMLLNTDAQIASDAEHFAFYNGVPIIKIRAMKNSAFSFGIIFMGSSSNANLVRHEYGHAVHFAQIGAVDYLAKVALPSVASFWLFPQNDYYESQPWEYIAEYFGQTNPPPNGYLDFADELAYFYWIYTIIF